MARLTTTRTNGAWARATRVGLLAVPLWWASGQALAQDEDENTDEDTEEPRREFDDDASDESEPTPAAEEPEGVEPADDDDRRLDDEAVAVPEEEPETTPTVEEIRPTNPVDAPPPPPWSPVRPAIVPAQPTPPPPTLAPAPRPYASGYVTTSEDPNDDYDHVAYYPSLDDEERATHGFVPNHQVGILLGGGVTNLSAAESRAAVGTGGSWNVRALLGTRQVVGLEAAYVGAALPLENTTNSMLVRHGGEMLLRLQVPLAVGNGLFAPYAVGGLGWHHHSVSDGPQEVGGRTFRQDTMETPVGGGFMIANGGFILDARFMYRFSFDENLNPTRSTGADLDSWMLGGNIGWEF